MNVDLAESLIATMPSVSAGLFNPWRQGCEFDSESNGPKQRLTRLAQHLDCDARVILVGEAPGYQGARYSGVGFTSEKLLMAGAIPRIAAIPDRLTKRSLPFSEPSSTLIWKALYRLGVAEETVLWNALQLHPFCPGTPWSNRTPSPAELKLGSGALKLLRDAYPSALLIAVGRNAEHALALCEIPYEAGIRHPANGGANDFARGLENALRNT